MLQHTEYLLKMKKENTSISEITASANPFEQFDIWFRERLDSGALLPDSVALGTASPDGKVSVRVVLLKEYNPEGFVFFTNYGIKRASSWHQIHGQLLHFTGLKRVVRSG